MTVPNLIAKLPLERKLSIARNTGYKVGRGLIGVDDFEAIINKYRDTLSPEQDKQFMAEFWAGVDAGKVI